ncbi:MAG: hypothetical protein ABUL60_11660, partial [Myxococcales bacterium]
MTRFAAVFSEKNDFRLPRHPRVPRTTGQLPRSQCERAPTRRTLMLKPDDFSFLDEIDDAAELLRALPEIRH